jgi:hypothetical protein
MHAFPLDILIFPLSVITIAADDKRLMCGGFSLGETVHFVNFEFITDYFGGLSLSPRRGDSGAAFMGSTRSGTPSPWWAMIEDPAEEFFTASSGEGCFGLPSPRRRDTGTLPPPIATTPWMENTLATQATMMVPLRKAVLRSDTGLPFLQLASLLCNATLVKGAGGSKHKLNPATCAATA